MLITFRPVDHFIWVTVLQYDCASQAIEDNSKRVDIYCNVPHPAVHRVVVICDFPDTRVELGWSCSVKEERNQVISPLFIDCIE